LKGKIEYKRIKRDFFFWKWQERGKGGSGWGVLLGRGKAFSVCFGNVSKEKFEAIHQPVWNLFFEPCQFIGLNESFF
jgi:hypothetical protein